MKRTDAAGLNPVATLALALLAAAAAGVLVLLIDGRELANPLLLGVLAASAVAALAAWAGDRARTRRHAALDERRRGEMAERARQQAAEQGKVEDDLEALKVQLEAQRGETARERRLRLRTERARQAEREWGRELRRQVVDMYKTRGASGDVRELVLEIAMQLSGAQKGLLLSQRDEDGDGRLDLVCHSSFDHDPSDSSLVQRFADRVMERDEIVREDSPGAGGSAADEEIESLVAVPVFMQGDFHGVVICANRPGGFEELDDDVLLALGDHAGAALENQRLHGRLRSSYLAVVRMLADAIEAKDPFVRIQSDQISACVERVARRLELEPDAVEKLVFASLLRDVGKLGISDRVLLKPGPLNADERRIVQLHPLIGARIVERVAGLAGLAPAIRHHHERWDGAGYPGGLSGEDIPLESRVIAVADVYSALTSTRPYRQPVSSELACEEIERSAGTQFDPRITRLFVEEIRRHGRWDADDGTLADTIDVPAVQVEREPGEPLLGYRSIASTDHVTSLFSHRYLQEVAHAEATRAHRRQRPFSVVMVELTTLSEINRREGYRAGDRALHELGLAIEGALADAAGTAGRFSGRRLAVVLPDAGHTAAAALAARVAEACDGVQPPIRTAVAVWQHGDHGEDVLARARLALDESLQADRPGGLPERPEAET
jgi:diguanylate cyclase (GGDEF)-like protein